MRFIGEPLNLGVWDPGPHASAVGFRRKTHPGQSLELHDVLGPGLGKTRAQVNYKQGDRPTYPSS